jgi:hypothetical protein
MTNLGTGRAQNTLDREHETSAHLAWELQNTNPIGYVILARSNTRYDELWEDRISIQCVSQRHSPLSFLYNMTINSFRFYVCVLCTQNSKWKGEGSHARPVSSC